MITLSKATHYQKLSLIPELPVSYTSDKSLKSFLKLLIHGLSDNRS
jgi:hypothetical protein